MSQVSEQHFQPKPTVILEAQKDLYKDFKWTYVRNVKYGKILNRRKYQQNGLFSWPIFLYTACICECYLLAIFALHCHNFYVLSALHCHYLYILSALHCLYFHVLSELHCHYLYILSALHYHYLYILSALLCHNVQTREPASIRDESQLGVRMSVLD